VVRYRGELMQAAVAPGAGAMAAILGLADSDVTAACAAAAQGDVVEAVNFNAPSQVVIAGATAAVARAIEAANAKGAKRALPLPISVPAHSSLMQPAADRLRARLLLTSVLAPIAGISVYDVDVKVHGEPAAIREALVKQLHSPVYWTATVRAMIASGVTQIIECGPGKVLTGLNRRIDKNREIKMMALEDPASLAEALKVGRA
jgi:[acyl-carrier-protein] S-malonyltransferase